MSADTGMRGKQIMPIALLPLTAIFAALFAAPMALLVLFSFWKAGFFTVVHELTFGNYLRIVSKSLYMPILIKTLGWSMLAAAIMTVVAFAVSYAIVFKLRVWGPRILVLVMGSLLSSYIVRLYALTTILGTNGLINQALMATGLIEEPLSFLLHGYFAIVVTLVYVYLPMAILPIYAAMQGIDRRLVEASRDLGNGPGRACRSVILPLAMRGVRMAFAFTFILAASDYMAPRMVGGLDGQMVGAVIADQFGGASNFPLGAALAICLIIGFAVCLGMLGLLERAVAGVLRHNRWRAKVSFNLPVSEIVTALALIFLFSPLLTVFVFSFNSGRNPGLPLQGLTLSWYASVLVRPDFHRAISTSLIIATISVVVALAIGLPAALSLSRDKIALPRLFNVIVFGPMAVPGVVLGVALLATFVTVGIRLGTIPTVAAHILLVLPFVVLVLRARIDQLPLALDEAARDLGASSMRVFFTVTLPLVAPSVLGAGILAAALSLDELLVTSFTIGAQSTMPVWVAAQMRTGLTPSLNAVAIMILGCSVGLIAISSAALRSRQSTRLTAALGHTS